MSTTGICTCVFFRLGLVGILSTTVTNGTLAQPSNMSVSCSNPEGKGAIVDIEKRCAFFRHFASENGQLDERVAQNLHVEAGKSARSIAVLIGISKYRNPEFDLPAAHVDVQKLERFLIDDQKFDEVIVLENEDVTIENIRYFLRTYATRRSAFFRGKVRFLVAYSGHGVPIAGVWDSNSKAGTRPSIGIVLPAAVDDQDLQNIYGLNELRPLFTDLARNTFHFLALINACYGGAIFGLGIGGGNINDVANRSSYGITAGPDDKTVISLGEGHGSLFFETLIKGIQNGDADSDARRVTLGLDPGPKSYTGIVRLGALDAYLTKQILQIAERGGIPESEMSGNTHHWSGPIEPDDKRSEGGFFFFQRRLTDAPASEATSTTYAASKRFGKTFAPSLNQLQQPQTHDDGFGALRSLSGVKRGIDVNHFNSPIDWKRVAATHDIRFAYMKATQGAAFADPSFGDNWKGAHAAGLMRGAYHVFSFCRSPEEQVANLRKVVGVDSGELPVALDIELYRGQGTATLKSLAGEGACAQSLGPAGVRKNVMAMLDSLRSSYGKQPILYGNDYLLDEVLGTEFTKGITLWRASYGVQQAPKPPWALWQFTQNEAVKGIRGRVDVNVVSDTPSLSKTTPQTVK
ncbi:Lysozyme M1 [Caballeronia novacaledonica]|uniref:Lysozyme M1 n=1 Tax=Caballeronia novacaledonica TaxID=1544861 RepID=A0A2U3IFQ6_9BURK|nr:GH25 family lysozyme [Caballeronia novacaledonica]SPB18966.1 Lysozyme M1 [Caballeronia novacaledonica]